MKGNTPLLPARLACDCDIITESKISKHVHIEQLYPREEATPERLVALLELLEQIKLSLNANHWTCFSLRAQGYTTREVASLAGVSHITALLGIKRGNALLEAMV